MSNSQPLTLRLVKSRWWAYSDNPDHKHRPLAGDDAIIGRVAWWARTLVEGEPQPASR